MAKKIELGILRGYSDSGDFADYGKFKMYFYYDSAIRANGGNSKDVTFTNCYVQAVPYYDNQKWTSNTLYIDSVSIGNSDEEYKLLGIEDSWQGCTSSGKPQGHTTNKVTITRKAEINTTSFTITLKGHRSGQEAKAQKLTGTITFDKGWWKIGEPTINVENNGDNTVTISGKMSTNNTNNTIKSAVLSGIIGNGPTTYYYSLAAKSGGSYSKVVKLDESEKMTARIKCVGTQGDVHEVEVVKTGLKFYSQPDAPGDLWIELDDNNTVTITATPGDGGANNPSKGIEIYYTLGGAKPDENSIRYTGPFIVSGQDVPVWAAARTVGTYTGNNKQWLYSDFVRLNKSITSYSCPASPLELSINDTKDNSYYFSVMVGTDGDNNSARSVEIFYTTNGSEPTDSSERILLYGSEYQTVASMPFNITKDTTVKAFARTVGYVDSHLYSENTDTITQKVLYYQNADIETPTITYDKKLTKRSIIKINHALTVYQYTKCTGYKTILYWNDIPFKTYPAFLTRPYLGDSDGYRHTFDDEYELSQYNNTTIVIDGQTYTINFNKGDCIKVEVTYQVYPIDGSTANYNYPLGSTLVSDEYCVDSNGIVRVKPDGVWREGQVWIKVNDEWIEATDVYIKTNNGWHESI